MKRAVVAILILTATSPCFAKYSGGSGDPNDPYQIATAEDLNDIANHTEDSNKCFIMTADINLAQYTGSQFNIIGDYTTPFMGVFDGNNHVISNFTYSNPIFGFVGLFGQVGKRNDGLRTEEIKNLTLYSPDVKGYMVVGSLVGYFCGTLIYNCHCINGHVEGLQTIGGVIGAYGGGDGPPDTDTGQVLVESCSFTGLVSSSGTEYNPGSAGGLAGRISPEGASSSLVKNCWASGSILSTDYAGGLVCLLGASVIDCWADCDVCGVDIIGGLIGYNKFGSISNCFSTGVVTSGVGSSYLGGLVGENEGGSISDCYFLDVAGPNNGLGTPLTDTQMKQQSSFVDWDFNDIWHICEGTNYPKLLWQILATDFLCPDGVTFVDFSFLASHWLQTDYGDVEGAELTGDGIVDIADLLVFTRDWLTGF